MRGVFTSLILGISIAGCGAAEMSFGADGEEPWVDTDGDGLSDSEELELGLDPEKSDTDGDGYSDGVEDNSYTDPGNPNDHPYYGGWPIDSCRYDIVGTGSWGEGEIIDNITLMDQYGENLKVHDFCNHVVLFEHAGFG